MAIISYGRNLRGHHLGRCYVFLPMCLAAMRALFRARPARANPELGKSATNLAGQSPLPPSWSTAARSQKFTHPSECMCAVGNQAYLKQSFHHLSTSADCGRSETEHLRKACTGARSTRLAVSHASHQSLFAHRAMHARKLRTADKRRGKEVARSA